MMIHALWVCPPSTTNGQRKGRVRLHVEGDKSRSRIVEIERSTLLEQTSITEAEYSRYGVHFEGLDELGNSRAAVDGET